MTNDFVTIGGNKYYVKDGLLDLSDAHVSDITKIEGLEITSNRLNFYFRIDMPPRNPQVTSDYINRGHLL